MAMAEMEHGQAAGYDNPMGLDGFEFVEFTHPEPDALAGLFDRLGFTHVGTHRSKDVRHSPNLR